MRSVCLSVCLSYCSRGLGYEFWRSSCLHPLQSGLCDFVLAVSGDGPSEDLTSSSPSSFHLLKALAEQVDLTLPVIKLSSRQLRLDEDSVDSILSVLLHAKGQGRSRRELNRAVRGHPSPPLAPKKLTLTYPGIYGTPYSRRIPYPMLTSVTLCPSDRWDIASILSVLQQVLFRSPSGQTAGFGAASALVTGSQAAWQIPKRRIAGLRSFDRIRQLATAKATRLPSKNSLFVS